MGRRGKKPIQFKPQASPTPAPAPAAPAVPEGFELVAFTETESAFIRRKNREAHQLATSHMNAALAQLADVRGVPGDVEVRVAHDNKGWPTGFLVKKADAPPKEGATC